MKKLLTLIIVLIIGFSPAFAQSFKLLNLYTDQYPEIKIEFKVQDENGDEIRSFFQTDFEINENCADKTPTIIECPPQGQSKVSYIFTLDRSPSMFELAPDGSGQTKGQKVIKAFEKMLDYLPSPNRWEAAVVSFAGLAYVMQDFTNDKDSLLEAVKETYKTSRAQTDFNAGFLYDVNDNPGALTVAKKAKYKPVVIFMTDGEHNFQRNVTPSRVNVWTGQIISTANNLVISTGEQLPATIFALTLGFPMPDYLRTIANATPDGEAIEASLNDEVISRIIVGIINKAGSLGPLAPCEMTWMSCCEGGDLHITCKLNGITIDTVYSVPDNLKPYLEVSPSAPYFHNVPPGISKTKKIKVTARNNYVLFDKKNPYTIDDPNFDIIAPDFSGMKLKKDSTIELTLQYTSPDSNYHFANISFISTACQGNNWSADAGWLYQNEVYVGSGTVGNPRNSTITKVICNFTGRTVRIEKMYPKDGDAGDFSIFSPKPPYDLPPDSCLKVTFSFNPSEEGTRSTTLVTETSMDTLKSRLWGDGSGFPEIQVSPADNITYPNSDCRAEMHDTTITITNIGALALEISNISLSNSTDFEQVSWPSIPLTLSPNASEDFTVRFNPKSVGNKTSVMSIESNSKNNPTYNVNLSGTRDSIGFSLSPLTINFGDLCTDEVGTQEITLTNTGSTDITLNANDDGNFTVAPNTWTLAPGASATVNISFSSATENTYNGTITFTDDFCNYSKSISLTAKVSDPAISSVPLTLQSTVGSSKTGVMTITNSSDRDLTISTHNIQCNEMQILSPPLPWIIPAGQTLDITIEYTPVNDNYLTCFITLEGTPCKFLDSVQVNGSPDLATASIEIEKHTGYAGFNVQIPIYLRDMNKVIESGASQIDTRISYDQNLLGNPSISNGTVTVNTGNIDIQGMDISKMNGDVLAVLTFLVNLSTPETTVLDISNTVSIGGGVNFSEIDGEFKVLPTRGTIEIGKAKGKTGEIVTIPIKLSNYQNFVAAHENILTTLTYNYSVLEPIGNFSKGTIDKDLRVIDLTLPVTPDSEGILANLKFKVMLGTADNIPLILTNTKTALGYAEFTEINGNFEVTNVCSSGEQARLFDPKGVAQIVKINPNPSNGASEIIFEAQEEGLHSIDIYSYTGEKILSLMNKELQPGVFEITFNTDKIADGSYFIIYKTPTKVITQTFGIIK